MVIETMRIAGSASLAMIASLSPGTRKSTIDAGDACAMMTGILLDHRRQPVLRGETLAPGLLGRAARRRRRSPSRGPAPGIEQIVEIDRLVGAVEIADAEMHDAGRQVGLPVARRRNRLRKPGKRVHGEFQAHVGYLSCRRAKRTGAPISAVAVTSSQQPSFPNFVVRRLVRPGRTGAAWSAPASGRPCRHG